MPDDWPDSMQNPCVDGLLCIYPRHQGVPIGVWDGQSCFWAPAHRLLRRDERVGIAGDAYTENRHGLWLSVAATVGAGVGSSTWQVSLTNSANCRKASATDSMVRVAEANARARLMCVQRARAP